MQKRIRPDPAHAASDMAANHAKVARYIETLAGRVDELVAATVQEDWNEVQRVSRQLAEGGRACGYRAVSALARRVCDEAHRPNNTVGVKQSLIRLIGTCGRVTRSKAVVG